MHRRPSSALRASKPGVTVRCQVQETQSKVRTVQLGRSGVQVPEMGIGAWSWGDRSGYWGYDKSYGRAECRSAYDAIIESGLVFIDTAEVYGFGKSEELLGEFMKETGTQPLIASKFAPQPWRWTADTVPKAARASLDRLGVEQMALYMQHWPGFLLNAFTNDAYLEGFARVADQGLARAVGTSNFNERRVRKAAAFLAGRGTCLASNQVQYSLIYRWPERNGVLEACRENGVTLIAYSPLCQGLLTGKYSADPSSPTPSGPRSVLYSRSKRQEVQVLVDALRAVGGPKGKTPAQVALNWLICQGVVPIPGAKTRKQVEELAGAVGWRLEEGEIAELDAVSQKIVNKVPGAPFENW